MSSALRLAWRYVTYYRWRSTLLASGIAAASVLPIALALLVDDYSRTLSARADATPLVCGAKGSRYDLILSTLYFTGRVPEPLAMNEVESIQRSGLATPIPILTGSRAQGFPVVGVDAEYFRFRSLAIADGRLPLRIGETVLGARAARELGLASGDAILTDQENLYDLASSYPLRMHVVGVLRETGTADDLAVLCDIKTAWIVLGIGHGHASAAEQSSDRVIEKNEDGIVLNASVREWNEITPENAASFHFHGEAKDLPVTGILVVPKNERARTKLKGRYRVSAHAQLLAPRDVIDELLGFVFRIKRFFDANSVLVVAAAALFLSVIVTLSLNARRREIETYFKIGCARGTVVRVFALELLLTVVAGLVLASVFAGVLIAVIRAGGGPLS